MLAQHTWSAVGSLVDREAGSGGTCPQAQAAPHRVCPQRLMSNNPQISAGVLWSSGPRKVTAGVQLLCPEKPKATVAFKDRNEGLKQILFLRRPQTLVGFPSCRHSRRAEGEARALPAPPGVPAPQWKPGSGSPSLNQELNTACLLNRRKENIVKVPALARTLLCG